MGRDETVDSFQKGTFIIFRASVADNRGSLRRQWEHPSEYALHYAMLRTWQCLCLPLTPEDWTEIAGDLQRGPSGKKEAAWPVYPQCVAGCKGRAPCKDWPGHKREDFRQVPPGFHLETCHSYYHH